MYFDELNVHTVGPSMTPKERLMTHFGGHDPQFGNHWAKQTFFHVKEMGLCQRTSSP